MTEPVMGEVQDSDQDELVEDAEIIDEEEEAAEESREEIVEEPAEEVTEEAAGAETTEENPEEEAAEEGSEEPKKMPLRRKKKKVQQNFDETQNIVLEFEDIPEKLRHRQHRLRSLGHQERLRKRTSRYKRPGK